MTGETDAELVTRALHVAGVHGAVRTDRDAWLEWRRNGLGASDIAAVLGLSPWASPYSIWARKAGLTPEQDQTEAMEFGSMAEQMLARYFEDRTGLWAVGEQTRCEHQRHPWMRCTVDGFAYEAHGALEDRSAAIAVIEYKTTSDAPEAWSPDVPLHYQCQATWTSIVTGHPVVMFGVLHLAFGRPAFRVYTFQPNADDIRTVMARATTFWNDHVLTGVAPDVDASQATTDALQAVFDADPDAAPIAADPSLAMVLERIAANQQRITDCQRVIDEQKNIIREAMGTHTELTLGVDAKGKPKTIATWRTEQRAGYVVEPSSSRVLRVKTGKPK